MRVGLVRLLLGAAALLCPGAASAEKILASSDGWQVYSDGQVGAFGSWIHGQGYPVPTYAVDASGKFVSTPIFTVQGGGFKDVTEQGIVNDPSLNVPPGVALPNRGTIDTMSIRSGFIGNVLGFGVRGAVTPTTSFNVYVQLWSFVESASQLEDTPNYPDARQGYAEIEGRWGSLLVGRTRALFSRGLADIEVLYRGPTDVDRIFRGGNFGAAVVYETPRWSGLRLGVGLFEPTALDGLGWTRTKYVRPEAELGFDRRFGHDGAQRIVLFADGAYQKVYKDGLCSAAVDAETGEPLPCEQTMAGVALGGRLELGPVYLGAAGYYQAGLGLNDSLEIRDAEQDPLGNLRWFRGAYIQSKVALSIIDLFAGWGMVRMFPSDYDRGHTAPDPRDPMNPQARVVPFSVIANQTAINAGIIYHATRNLHLDLDLFRAQASWTAVDGYRGPTQVIYVTNGGLTMNW
jgi:hypothetical protein